LGEGGKEMMNDFSSEKVADVSKMCYLCKRKIINA